MSAASDTIVEHVEAGRDVRIQGAEASVRLDEAAARLGDRFNVVRLTAPAGGMNLSALIAQLSGRDKFDEHDDAALEAGFRRLSGADTPERRTVVLLDATQGVQRPVLRYLQQVGRSAPALRYVIASFPELDAFLEAPDMARLRDRLGTIVATGAPELPRDDAVAAMEAAPEQGRALVLAPVVAPVGAPTVAPVPMPVVVANAGDAWAAETARRATGRAQRRTRRIALMWTSSGVALAASVVFGAWLGQAPAQQRDAAMPAPARTVSVVQADGPTTPAAREHKLLAVPASVATPPLAARVAPVPVPPVAPSPAMVPTQVGSAASPGPALAKPSAPETVASGEPQPAVPASPDKVGIASVEERVSSPSMHMHSSEQRRVAATAAMPRQRVVSRTRAPAEMPRMAQDETPVPYYGVQELPPEEPMPRRGRARLAREPMGSPVDYYGREAGPPVGEPDYRSGRYEQPADGGYIGTYSTGPYGARVFRYGP